MKRVLRRAAMLVVALSGAELGAYQWPVEGPTIIAAFGQIADAHFLAGVSLASRSAEVRPIAAGEIIFRYDPASNPTSLPRGLGAHVVVEHGEKVRSTYAHLAPFSVAAATSVQSTTTIGRMGDSGAALGPSLGLAIIDMETVSYLNPCMVLPPLADRQPPVIARVLARRDGTVFDLGARPPVGPGAVRILLEAYDLREDVAYRWRLAPHAAVLSVNGRQVSSVVFDTLRAGGEHLVEAAGRSATSTYAGPWLLDLGSIQLQLGETRLQVLVRDYAGNESSREYFLSIRG